MSKVVIAGGGLIGCAIAWRLAERGADVCVIESSQPGAGASSAAAGMLAPLIESHHEQFRSLAIRSIALFPQFVEQLHAASGIDAELQLTGKVDVAFDDDDLAALRASYGDSFPEGVREVSAANARTIEPQIADNIAGAIVSERDGSVDNKKLTRAAWQAARNAGAQFLLGSSVQEVSCRNGVEVQLSNGQRITGDSVVVSAGAWSGSIRGLPQNLPVTPVRGQMIALERLPRALSRIVMTRQCYMVPRRDGRVLVGSTVEHVGFDTRTTPHGIAGLLDAARRVVPALADASVAETWAGLRPGTPDDLPILGADPRAPGVFYATGHFRNGILLAPITAELLVKAVVGEQLDMDIAAFSSGRFHE